MWRRVVIDGARCIDWEERVGFENEEDVKRALGIGSWRSLSKDKVMRFATEMPKMSEAVLLKIIQQFPKFKELALDTLSILEREHRSTLESNSQSQERSHNAFQEIRRLLEGELSREDLSEEDRRFIIGRIMETGDREFEKDSENKRFLDGLFNKAIFAGAAAIVAALVFVGAKVAFEREHSA